MDLRTPYHKSNGNIQEEKKKLNIQKHISNLFVFCSQWNEWMTPVSSLSQKEKKKKSNALVSKLLSKTLTVSNIVNSKFKIALLFEWKEFFLKKAMVFRPTTILVTIDTIINWFEKESNILPISTFKISTWLCDSMRLNLICHFSDLMILSISLG